VGMGSERVTMGFGVTEVTLGKGARTLELPFAQNEKQQEDSPFPIFGNQKLHLYLIKL